MNTRSLEFYLGILFLSLSSSIFADTTWTCYVNDRIGNQYSGSQIIRSAAQNIAMNNCQTRSSFGGCLRRLGNDCDAVESSTISYGASTSRPSRPVSTEPQAISSAIAMRKGIFKINGENALPGMALVNKTAYYKGSLIEGSFDLVTTPIAIRDNEYMFGIGSDRKLYLISANDLVVTPMVKWVWNNKRSAGTWLFKSIASIQNAGVNDQGYLSVTIQGDKGDILDQATPIFAGSNRKHSTASVNRTLYIDGVAQEGEITDVLPPKKINGVDHIFAIASGSGANLRLVVYIEGSQTFQELGEYYQLWSLNDVTIKKDGYVYVSANINGVEMRTENLQTPIYTKSKK